MTVQAFISEMIKAANQLERLSELEKALLLNRASRTIQDMRDELGIAGNEIYDETNVAGDMRMMARKVSRVPNNKTQEALLIAVEAMKTLQTMLDAKREVEENSR